MFGLVLARPSPNKLICLLAVFCIRYEVETKFIPFALVGYEVIITNKRVKFYHFISNAGSWNNNYSMSLRCYLSHSPKMTDGTFQIKCIRYLMGSLIQI